jgi:hypothetical protein
MRLSVTLPSVLFILPGFARPGWGLLIAGVSMVAIGTSQSGWALAVTSYQQQANPAKLFNRLLVYADWASRLPMPAGAAVGAAVVKWAGPRLVHRAAQPDPLRPHLPGSASDTATPPDHARPAPRRIPSLWLRVGLVVTVPTVLLVGLDGSVPSGWAATPGVAVVQSALTMTR